MTPKRLDLGDLRKAVGVGRIFGDPVERDGVIVIPAATVLGGGGGGERDGGSASGTPETGMGFGMIGWPSGAYEIRDGRTRWIPAVDVTRLILALMLFAFLALRAILRARQ